MIGMTSNISDVVERIIVKLPTEGSPDLDALIRTVATTMKAEIGHRVHNKGEDASGGDIGKYSKWPMTVTVDSDLGIFLKGKNGKPVKSKFYPGGYEQFKTEIGRNRLGKVNLSLSGQLAKQFTVIATANGYGLGWPNDEMPDRARKLEKKYDKKIFSGLTDDEKQLAKEVAENFVNNALS